MRELTADDLMRGRVPYATITRTIAAGERVSLSCTTRFLSLVAATASNAVRISFNGASFSLLPQGILIQSAPGSSYWLENTSGAPNTVVIAVGDAEIRDNRLLLGDAGKLPVTAADGDIITLGAQADLAAGADTGSMTMMALMKRLLAKFGTIGQKTMAGSAPVVIASDQAPIPVSASGNGFAAITRTANEVASAARTVDGQSAAIPVTTRFVKPVILPTAASGTSPFLCVQVEGSANGTTQWVRLSTTVAYPGGTFLEFYGPDVYVGCFSHYRYVWWITGTTPSFTFSIDTIKHNEDLPIVYSIGPRGNPDNIATTGAAAGDWNNGEGTLGIQSGGITRNVPLGRPMRVTYTVVSGAVVTTPGTMGLVGDDTKLFGNTYLSTLATVANTVTTISLDDATIAAHIKGFRANFSVAGVGQTISDWRLTVRYSN